MFHLCMVPLNSARHKKVFISFLLPYIFWNFIAEIVSRCMLFLVVCTLNFCVALISNVAMA